MNDYIHAADQISDDVLVGYQEHREFVVAEIDRVEEAGASCILAGRIFSDNPYGSVEELFGNGYGLYVIGRTRTNTEW